MRFFLLAAVYFLPAMLTNALANVSLPAIFSDSMVLQQKTGARFWGWADAGEKITITTDWSARAELITGNSGEWSVTLQTPAAGGPYNIYIKGKNEQVIREVLIGEVWVCSGQSNMVFSLKASDNAAAEIANADFPSIRYFSVERQYGPRSFKDAPGSVWKKTSPQTAPSFSAVAYYFAKKIHQTLHVPVGIIYSAWGGTPAEAWTPPAVLQQDDSLSRYIDRWKRIQDNVGKDSTAYHTALNEWERKRAAGDTVGLKKPSEPRTLYFYKRPWREPGVLYNGMINPVVPYAIKGVLWYQGESNVGYADEYEYLFGNMIKSWRDSWQDKNLPFYFVQIAPYGYNSLDAAARLRQGQNNITKKIPHTGMAVTVDVGNMDDIHFTHKKEVGERLAWIALAKDYGKTGTVYIGPGCIKMMPDKNRLKLIFDQEIYTDDHLQAGGFEIGYKVAGSDSLIYVKAQAAIHGREITVWNDQVSKPLAVRYAWLEIGEANIINKRGLPAAPFQKEL